MSEHESATVRTPRRIQRVKGQPIPQGARYVGRRTVYANPYSLRPGERGEATATREYLVEDFQYWLRHPHDRFERPGRFVAPGFASCAESREARDRLLAALPALAGQDLACDCHEDQPCHGDALLILANPASPAKTTTNRKRGH
jgi:hypothetical protein